MMLIHNVKAYLERGRFAGAVLIEGDRIRGVGTKAEMTVLACSLGEAGELDGGGGLLLPGFRDSHMHLQHFGSKVMEINFRGVTSLDDLVERGRAALARIAPVPGSVIYGSGWNQEEFQEGGKRYPDRRDLDRISTDHALILARICGHTISCNTRALEMAGLTEARMPVPGEGIERDDSGRPRGIFYESAAFLLRRLIPPYSAAQIRSQIEYGMAYALEKGITSVDTNDVFEGNFPLITESYREILEEGKFRLRVGLQCALGQGAILEDLYRRGLSTGAGLGHPLLKMGPLKLFADGTLGSRTAFLAEPYADDPGNRGMRTMDDAAMAAAVREGDRRGFQVIVHAIGDAAADQTIRAFEAVCPGGRNPLRHGLVHGEVLSEALLDRMARKDITALVQPVFMTHDIFFAENRLGPARARWTLAFAALADRGIRTAYGTDSPVESMDPLEGIACAMLRRPAAAFTGGIAAAPFFPEEQVDLSTALDAYTQGGAAAAGEEDTLGRIRPGHLADLTLLDRDLFSLPPEDIPQARVCFTMVGGEFAFRSA